MRTYLLFPAGLLIGAALMWAFLSGRDAGTVGVRTGNGAPPRREIALPPPAEVSGPLSEKPRPADPVGADCLELPDFGASSAAGYLALATLRAIAGRDELFLEDAVKAIEAGADAEDVQAVIAHLPAELRPKTLEALVARLPGQPWDVSKLSELYRDAGDFAKAFDLLSARVEATSGDMTEISGLVDRMIDLDAHRAAELLDRLKAGWNWDDNQLTLLAGRFREAGQPELALPLLLQALEKSPVNSEAIEMLSGIDPAAAEPLARQAVDKQPDDSRLWAQLGLVLRRTGARSESFDAYARAVELEDDEDSRRVWLREMLRLEPARSLPIILGASRGGDDETLGVLGRAYAALGRQGDAFETFLRAHSMDEEDSEWLHRLVDVDAERAARTLREEIDRNGGTGDELIGTYASALRELGEDAQAFDRYLQALNQDQSDWEWLRGIAQSDPIRALPILQDREENGERSVSVIGALGDAYAGLGRPVDAIRQYERAIAIGEDSGRWMAALAQVDERRGIAMLRSALDENPEDDELWGALGDAYRGLGRIGDARAAYDKALELDPGDWEWNRKRDVLR